MKPTIPNPFACPPIAAMRSNQFASLPSESEESQLAQVAFEEYLIDEAAYARVAYQTQVGEQAERPLCD